MNKSTALRLLLVMPIALCSLFIGTALGAQEQIALHPFWGPEESDEITDAFFERTLEEIPQLVDGRYRTFPIDLSNLPADVPEGGFPPWISPSPAITLNAEYAITGEGSPDEDVPGAFRVRVYLWRMENGRLLGSDEMTVTDPESLDILPYFLDWVLSWIDTDEAPIVVSGVEDERHWLYLGLRGGGGYSNWTYDFRSNRTALVHDITTFMSANAALQVSVQLARFFELQTGINVISDFGPVDNHRTGEADGSLFTLELKIPVLAKLVLQNGRVKAGIFGGAYLQLPLMQWGSDNALDYYAYRADIPGFVFGMSAGWKLGPGRLFLDGRLEYDGHWFNEELELINYRRANRLSIGYEWGFFRKN